MPNEVALERGICALLKEKGLSVAQHRFVFLKTLYEWTSTSTHFSILLVVDLFYDFFSYVNFFCIYFTYQNKIPFLFSFWLFLCNSHVLGLDLLLHFLNEIQLLVKNNLPPLHFYP